MATRRSARTRAWPIGRLPALHATVLLLGCALGCLPQGEAAAADRGGEANPASQLVGAWRLVAVEYSGPRGQTVDPFYQADSTGIIIYDASGWMSVQISAPRRRAWRIPSVRVPATGGNDQSLKAEAFDTYYSYYGTWEYDAARSIVTHHVKSSVIPAETGLSYAQSVAFEGANLVLTVRSGNPGMQTVRMKIWQRLSSPAQ